LFTHYLLASWNLFKENLLRNLEKDNTDKTAINNPNIPNGLDFGI